MSRGTSHDHRKDHNERPRARNSSGLTLSGCGLNLGYSLATGLARPKALSPFDAAKHVYEYAVARGHTELREKWPVVGRPHLGLEIDAGSSRPA